MKRVLSPKHKSKQIIRKTLPPLRAEEHSAFTHNLWHRYDLIRLMQWSAKVLDQHHEQQGKYNYSAVQDAFYALNGLEPNESPAGKAWRKVQDAPGFDDLMEMMDDQFGAAAAVHEVATNFERFMMQEPDEQQAQEEKQEQEQRQQQQQPQPEPTPEPTPDEQGEEQEGDSDEQQQDSGQGEGQEDGSEGQDAQEGQDAPQDATEAQGDGSGSQSSGNPGGAPSQQPGQGAENEVVQADALAGLGVIKKEGQKGNSRMVVNAEVAQAAAEEAEAVSTVYSFLHEPVQNREARANELVELDLISLKSLVNFLGWMKRVVKGARRRGRAAVGEFTGYRPGTWGSNTHPMEMAEVAKGNPIYLTRLVENQLTNRTFKEDRPLGKGPVIILRDESDSMEQDRMTIDGKQCTLHQAALSFEVALATVMNKEKRDLVSIAWSSGDTRKYTYGEQGMDEHWGAFIGGGTRIEPALKMAMETAKEYVRGADVLVITDGDMQLDPRTTNHSWDAQHVEMLQEFRERGGRVWAIVINPKPGDVAHKLAWMDGWVTIQDMRAGEKVADMLEAMAADRIPAKGKGRVKV